jgi:hypothetical protein
MARTVGEPTSFFFADTRPGDPLGYEALQTRRKLMEQMAARRQNAYPRNVGEGIFSAGDSLAGALQQKNLEAQQGIFERGYQQEVDRASGRTAADATATEDEPTPSPVVDAGRMRDALTATALARQSDPYNPAPGPGATGPAQWPSGTRLQEYSGPPAAPGVFGQPGEGAVPASSEVQGFTTPQMPGLVRVAALGGIGVKEDPYRNPVTAAPSGMVPAPSGAAGTQVAQIDRPDPFSKPVPGPPAPPSGLLPARERPSDVEPPPPVKTPKSRNEVEAEYMARRNALNPPVAALWGAKAAEFAKERDFQDKVNDEAYKVKSEVYKTERRLSQEHAQTRPEKDFELSQKRDEAIRKKEEYDFFGPSGEAPVREAVLKNREKVAGIPEAMEAVRTAQEMLKKGVFTGQASRWNTLKARFAEGFLNADESQMVVNTEIYQASLRKLMGAIRAGIAGTGSQNPKEQQAVEQAIALDPSLQKGTMIGVLGNLHKGMLYDAIEHQDRANAYVGTNENRQRQWYPSMSLPMERVVPQSAVNDFIKQVDTLRAAGKNAEAEAVVKEFNDDFKTLGLGQRVLRFRRQ